MPDSGLEATYRAIREGVAWRVVPRDAVMVEGTGAGDWLQGQISQDLDRLGEPGASAETLVLSPQGKIDSYCRVTRLAGEPPRYLLDTKAGTGTELYERLRRFKLRVKATVEMLDRLHVLEQRGPSSTKIEGRNEDAEAPVRAMVEELGGLGEVAVSWPGVEGTDWLFTGDPAGITGLVAALGFTGQGADVAGDDGGFEAARIEAGTPELGSELTARTIPQEAGDLVARTVSFTKGCYTGQELVARIDARGSNVPRRLRGLVVPELAMSDVAGLAGSVLRQGDRNVGEVTSAAWSPGLEAAVALAYVKRGVDLPAEVMVDAGPAGEGGDRTAACGEVRELPISGAQAAGGRS